MRQASMNRIAGAAAVLALAAGAMATAEAGPLSPLAGDNLAARVRGTVAGNWEVAVGDQVGVAGGAVTTTGDDPWIGTNIYDFSLNYSSVTGLADFQVSGTGFTSSLLTTPSYGIIGFGFNSIDLGLRTRDNTTLTISNLVLNATPLMGGPYVGTTTYTDYNLYSGAVLGNISLTGKFVMTGDYTGNGESTRFDLRLNGAQRVPVPEPGSLALSVLGLGLALAARRRKKA